MCFYDEQLLEDLIRNKKYLRYIGYTVRTILLTIKIVEKKVTHHFTFTINIFL